MATDITLIFDNSISEIRAEFFASRGPTNTGVSQVFLGLGIIILSQVRLVESEFCFYNMRGMATARIMY